MKDRRVIYRETLFVLAGSLVLSLVMELVFLLLGRWRPAVLYGNLLTVFATTLNYYLMCRALLRALAAGGDENNVKARMKASASARLLLLGLIVAGGCYASVRWNAVDLWATLIPLLFVRLTLFVRSRMIAHETPTADPFAAAETTGVADDTPRGETETAAPAKSDPTADATGAPAPEMTTAADPSDVTPAAATAPDAAPCGTSDGTSPTGNAGTAKTTDGTPASDENAPAPFRTDRRGRPIPPSLSELLKGGETDDD